MRIVAASDAPDMMKEKMDPVRPISLTFRAWQYQPVSDAGEGCALIVLSGFVSHVDIAVMF